ncbi:RES family NAD+ phosphorylase [Arcicella lustrica]|uniref:RES family NAD+ phosphorylase n=1 Tax=Arcicella lustrica TaxID=2984196 RepID=A0ABU5SIE8_9BACT|nr:RES family NAD+ phosphorylase [Arcicella sp. DC25W]MEA5427039.1 RES family NAD+ phosphorylase [Arcicella sp. DC25W]
MDVFRISKFKRARDLSGFGASLKGQRWNRRGTSLLYTASHRSLALLEVLVHIGEYYPEDDYAIITLDIPENQIVSLDASILPKDWAKIFDAGVLASFTDHWLKTEQSIALGVPSAIVPQETNYLINPLHPDFQDVKIKNIEKFTFDERFFKDVID